jgi:5-methyltetrahydropteroyltriglutamate--homocysteine methyltransferase
MQQGPFRADHVGSLLRRTDVRDARAAVAAGNMQRSQLKAIEDDAIRTLIARQESIGLQGITDGETRRAAWHLDFFEGLQGTAARLGDAVRFAGVPAHKVKIVYVTGKLGFGEHPMLEHFRFLKAHIDATAKATAKMCIPSPIMFFSALRDWRECVDPGVKPDLDEIYDQLGRTYRAVLKGFYDAGCRYLQMDECNLAYLCDPAARARLKARGDDPQQMFERWIELLNSALEGRPAGMTVTTHICRGNFRSTWAAQGGYEPIADQLFNRVNVDGYFLEYDTERAGGFEPLRLFPRSGKRLVLGLISSKTGTLERADDIKRRIDQATEYVDLEQLAVSPQCGFASTEEGNVLAEEEQWAKLRMAVEIARDVWK